MVVALSDEIHFDREALVLALKDDQRWKALQSLLDDAEAAWTEKAYRQIMKGTKPVDQRKVDFMRGYFAGARYWTLGRIKDAETRIALSGVEKEDEE